jgi:drug/metabolite transporter (DMT)-like permease
MALAQGGSLRPSPDALLILAAAVAQALFFVLQKPLLSRYRGFEVTCYAMWSGTLLALPLPLLPLVSVGGVGARPMIAMLFLGIAPSAIGFVTWAYAQARLTVATAANALYLVPFLAIGIGWVILGETAHPAAVGGGLVALAGVAVSRSRPRRLSRDRDGEARQNPTVSPSRSRELEARRAS